MTLGLTILRETTGSRIECSIDRQVKAMMIDSMIRFDQHRQLLSRADSQLSPPRNPPVIASFSFSATRKVTHTLGSTRTSPGPIPL